MKKTAHGILFAVPLPDGTFLSGRVMLDIYACLKRRLFPADSPLPGLGKAYLIEMYSAVSKKPEHVPSDLLIRGAFVESDEVGNSWPIVGHKTVDPHEVEFPESIIGFMHPNGACAFEHGEIEIPLPLPGCIPKKCHAAGFATDSSSSGCVFQTIAEPPAFSWM